LSIKIAMGFHSGEEGVKEGIHNKDLYNYTHHLVLSEKKDALA
jgi:hypothetical protein